MFSTKTMFTAAALLASALFTTTTVEAQSQSKYGTYYKSIGNQYLGGVASAYGRVGLYRSGSYASASGELLLRGTVRFLKQTKDIAKVSATASSRGQAGAPANNAAFKLDLAGKRILDRSFKNTATVARWTRTIKAFPTDIKMGFPVGPFTVTAKGNVGLGLSAAARFTLGTTTIGARIDGDGKAWAYGTASVAVGIPGASVGVEADARFANQTLAIHAGASARDGLTGSLTYTIRAISLKLKGFVKILWKKWSTTLVEWQSAQLSRTLFRL